MKMVDWRSLTLLPRSSMWKQGVLKENDKEDARRGIGEGNKEASVEERKTRTEESWSDDKGELQK